MTPAIIRATFHDWRTVKGRKQLQLIFEVPLEQQEQVLHILGAPLPDRDIWVAIARMQIGPQDGVAHYADSSPEPDPVPAGGPASSSRPRRRFSELPRSQQAALRCRSEDFRAWLTRSYPNEWGGACEVAPEALPDLIAAEAVRRLCGVVSRSDLDADERAGRRWDALDTEFEIDTGRMAEPRP